MTEDKQKKMHVISFRLTDEQIGKVDVLAEKHGRTRHDLCRAAVLHVAKDEVPAPVKPKALPPRRQPSIEMQELAKAMAELGKIGGNVNQMARIANSSGSLPQQAALETLTVHIQAARTVIENALTGEQVS